MNSDHAKQCHHIALLPPVPSENDLPMLRKGLRKMKLPEIGKGFYGSNDSLGKFRATSGDDGSISFEWNVIYGATKTAIFDDLCRKSELEFERLELGWLIMNMHALDRMHELEHIADPHEIMRAMNWFTKREEQWKRWSLVPAGHMAF
jgi:hypothetical protein